MRNRAFFLTEVLIYLFLFALFSLSVFRCVWAMYTDEYAAEEQIECKIRNLLPLDTLGRDFINIVPDKDYWDEENMVCTREVWSEQDGWHRIQVGWKLRENTLYQRTGTYDFKKKKWIKLVSRKICRGVSSCCWFFKPVLKRIRKNIHDEGFLVESGDIAGVQVEYQLEGHASVSIYLRVRNGEGS